MFAARRNEEDEKVNADDEDAMMISIDRSESIDEKWRFIHSNFPQNYAKTQKEKK